MIYIDSEGDRFWFPDAGDKIRTLIGTFVITGYVELSGNLIVNYKMEPGNGTVDRHHIEDLVELMEIAHYGGLAAVFEKMEEEQDEDKFKEYFPGCPLVYDYEIEIDLEDDEDGE